MGLKLFKEFNMKCYACGYEYYKDKEVHFVNGKLNTEFETIRFSKGAYINNKIEYTGPILFHACPYCGTLKIGNSKGD
jgi:hypothetical protein